MPGAGTLHIAIGTTHLTADISAIADGHGVRLRRRGHAFPQMMNPASGLGAVVTAAVLTAEAFKTFVSVAPNRHRLLDRVDFCPVTLGEPETAVSVPALDGAALIGGGAIGTAIALILRALYVRGSLLVVDPATYDEPNVSTYSLGSRDDATAEIDKVELIKRELPQIAVRPLKGTANDLIRVIDNGDEQLPDIVFGAVDSVDARHEIARLPAPGLATRRWCRPDSDGVECRERLHRGAGLVGDGETVETRLQRGSRSRDRRRDLPGRAVVGGLWVIRRTRCHRQFGRESFRHSLDSGGRNGKPEGSRHRAHATARHQFHVGQPNPARRIDHRDLDDSDLRGSVGQRKVVQADGVPALHERHPVRPSRGGVAVLDPTALRCDRQRPLGLAGEPCPGADRGGYHPNRRREEDDMSRAGTKHVSERPAAARCRSDSLACHTTGRRAR